MLVRRHLELKVENPVLSDYFQKKINEGDFFVEDAVQYLNIQKDGRLYALYYNGDSGRPFIRVPGTMEDVSLAVRDWLLPGEAYPGTTLARRSFDTMETDDDENFQILDKDLSERWEEIEDSYSYVYAEGYLAEEDYPHAKGLMIDDPPHLGHDIFVYDKASGEDAHYYTEPVSQDSPYSLGEAGGPGYLTLKINNPAWWVMNAPVVTEQFKSCSGSNVQEIDPASRGGKWPYDFVIRDFPLEKTYCPQTYADFKKALREFIFEHGLTYAPSEQVPVYGEYPEDLQAFFDAWSWEEVENNCRHVIWEVRDTKNKITERYEYDPRKRGAGYGGTFEAENA